MFQNNLNHGVYLQMTDKNQNSKPTGFAAKMKEMMAGCSGNCGCCCGDIKIVPKEETEGTKKPETSE